MTRTAYAPLWAYQMKQRGQYGDFKFILPEHDPQGVASGTPVVTPTSNHLLYSEEFENSEWTTADMQQKSTVESSNGDSAQVWTRVTGSGQWASVISEIKTTTAGQIVTYAVELKNTSNADRTAMNIYDNDSAGAMVSLYIYWDGVLVDSVSQTAGSTYSPGYGYEDIGDGWYRFYITATTVGNDCVCKMYPACDAIEDDDGDGLAIFGAQFEKDIETPSYYKKTEGTAIIDELPVGRKVGITGWLRDIAGQLKAGDFVKFSGHNKVYMVAEDCDSDGGGFGTLTIEPALYGTLLSGETLVIEDVPFRVRFADDTVNTDVDRNLFVGFNTKLIEAI
jgi:hypothetical protein